MNPQDDEPLVIVDDEADFAALPSASPLTAQGQDYLRAQGITDPATWAAFRLEQIDAATLVRLGFIGKRKLHAHHGISIPTCDPRAPDCITGIIRQHFAVNGHRFTTPPVGIAGPVTLVDAARVVLVPTPLLAMRLHQAGVTGLAVVEDPVVLPPLLDWLAGRELILAAHKRADIAALQSALGTLGADRPSVLISMASHRLSASVCALLGVTVQPPPEPVPPVTPILVQALHDHAVGRVAGGDAIDALQTMEADIPELVQAYQMGFLRPDYRAGLSRVARRAVVGLDLGGTLIMPAFDAAGVIADLLVVHTQGGGRSNDGMYAEPRGLLAPAIATSYQDLIVTDTFRWLARLFRQGHRNVLLLRGPEDAQHNASRLAACGVRQVTVRARQHRDAVAAALSAAGMAVCIDPNPVMADDEDAVAVLPASWVPSVTASAVTDLPQPPAQPSPAPVPEPLQPATDALVFIEHDRSAGTAIFQAGLVRYAVEWRDDGDFRRHVVIRAHSQTAQDRVDVSVEAQRQRFAGNAACRLNIPSATIAAHLAALLPLLQAQEDAQDRAPQAAVSAEDQALARQFLEAPDLLTRIAGDLAALGWIGAENTSTLLYLCALSRLLPRPVWAVHRAGAGAAPWLGLGCIAALTPPEDVVVFHQVTASTLMHRDQASLRHRLVIIDQAETLRPAAALALRILHERGGIGWSTAASAVGGGASMLGDLRGPVAVLAAAAGDLDHRCRDGFLTLQVDESPVQTAHLLASQRQHLGGRMPASPTATRAVIARHHAAQRFLERLPVVLPFVERIAFPAQSVRHRDEHAWFLTLIATSALLHQRQRSRSADGAIIASEADFTIVQRLTAGVLGVSSQGISNQARHLLGLLCKRDLPNFTMADLAGLCPDWTRYAFRAALHDLLDFGYLVSPRVSTRGKLRTFALVMRTKNAAGAADPASAIHLRAVGDEAPTVGELAAVGENGFANFTPEVASG